MPKKTDQILVGESDHFVMEINLEFLRKHFSDHSIISFTTEAEFRSIFDRITLDPPVLAILGMRMRWTDPAPEMPVAPLDVVIGTYRKAGSRCRQLLRQNEKTRHMPVIFYTPIDETNNVEQEVIDDPLTKFVEMSTEDEALLLATIKKMLRQNL